MELDVPTHSYSVLKERLQGIDKKKEIELYYELLSSGHSVGEILDSLNHLECKSAIRDGVQLRTDSLMSIESDVPAHLYNSLKERSQNGDKQGAIERYYELLSSGHSVGG